MEDSKMKKRIAPLKLNKRGNVGLLNAKSVFVILASLVILAFLVIVIIYNLSNSTVLPTGTNAANQSTAIFNNVTNSFATFFSYSGIWMTLLAIVVLVLIVVVALLVMNGFSGQAGGSGSSLG